jgi:hypothetical protein
VEEPEELFEEDVPVLFRKGDEKRLLFDMGACSYS